MGTGFSLSQYRQTVADLQRIRDTLEVPCQDLALLAQALSHSSYLREVGLPEAAGNQRLEFLGDAVLELVMSEHLYRHYPHLTEGQMTQYRARIVRTLSLAQAAQGIGLDQVLFLGADEEAAGGRRRRSILSNTLEAVWGAVFLDQGLEAARTHILKVMAPVLQDVGPEASDNFKGALQELTQDRFRCTPSYRTVRETGPQHNRTFVAEVCLGPWRLAQGMGRSKKEAEQAAAAAALRKLQARET